MSQTHLTESALHTEARINPNLLLVSQLVFNVGFYMVLPFLAAHLRDNLALAGAAVGLVLGVRTFSQQGLFVFGGALADTLGAKRIILLGCLIRAAGFLMLGFATSLPMILIGACLTGVGSALFSPAVSALLAYAGSTSKAQGGLSRSQLFARLAVWGECGAVLGPVLGALLLGISFQSVALVGAAVFILMFCLFIRVLPKGVRPEKPAQHAHWRGLLCNPLFLGFIAAYSTGLLCYNQLYLALPVELERAGGDDTVLASLFMLVSALVIGLQLPINRLTRHLGAVISLPAGFLLFATAFTVVALFAEQRPNNEIWALAPAFAMVSLIALGQMVVSPVAMDLIPDFAQGRPLGVYYGALASAGGVAVLLGNTLMGDLLDAALIPSADATHPWWVLASLPAVSALALFILLRMPFFHSSNNRYPQETVS